MYCKDNILQEMETLWIPDLTWILISILDCFVLLLDFESLQLSL